MNLDGVSVVDSCWINLRTASAAALLRQLESVGAFEADSNGSNVFFVYQTP